MPRKKKLYLVQRLAWRPVVRYDDGRAVTEQHESAEGVPVRAFETKAEATKYAKHLTAEARRELNPFQFTYCDLERLTGASDKELIRAVEKAGLPAPAERVEPRWGSESIDWLRWYDDLADTLIDAERDAIWDLLDRLELYRVVDVEFF